MNRRYVKIESARPGHHMQASTFTWYKVEQPSGQLSELGRVSLLGAVAAPAPPPTSILGESHAQRARFGFNLKLSMGGAKTLEFEVETQLLAQEWIHTVNNAAAYSRAMGF